MKYEGLKRVEVELCQNQSIRTVIINDDDIEGDYIVLESSQKKQEQPIAEQKPQSTNLLYTLLMQAAAAILILCACFLVKTVDNEQAQQAVSYIKTAITYDLFEEYRAEDYEPASSDFWQKLTEYFK